MKSKWQQQEYSMDVLSSNNSKTDLNKSFDLYRETHISISDSSNSSQTNNTSATVETSFRSTVSYQSNKSGKSNSSFLKVVLIGDSGVGKTSIIQNYKDKNF